MTFTPATKTVVVLGGAYGGARAAQLLAQELPLDWKLVLIDRNSHANHVYILPRLSVLSGHEHKAFVPYTRIFHSPDTSPGPCSTSFIQATVTFLTCSHVSFIRTNADAPESVGYDYLVYALGSALPAPVNLWGPTLRSTLADKLGEDIYHGFKTESMTWLKTSQSVIESVERVLVVGGGALGVQFASDIKDIHPTKHVTLLHSRDRLLNRFDEAMHSEILVSLEALGVEVLLNDRLKWDSVEPFSGMVRTESGKQLEADLLMLCTGQVPNTQILARLEPRAVDPKSGWVHVQRSMQVAVEGYQHLFAVGDVADAFGAIKAGHTAYWQACVAARNIMRLIQGKQSELEDYAPGPPAIKVTLGRTRSVTQAADGKVIVKEDEVEDLQARAIWAFFGYNVKKDDEMYD